LAGQQPRQRRTGEIDQPRGVGDRQAVAQRARHRHAELGAIGTQAQVARHGNGAAAADGRTVNLGNRRQRHALDAIDDGIEAPFVVDAGVTAGEAAELGNIRPGRERAAAMRV
jgi:hypothetical protein